MQSPLTAVVLCIFAQAAAAQCVADPAAQARTGAELAKPAAVVVTKPAPKTASLPGGELIKTAAAGTHDAPSAIVRETPRDDSEHPRRGGTAMLLAALALMSGIALRRYGAPRQ
jgi:hypothetical protein